MLWHIFLQDVGKAIKIFRSFEETNLITNLAYIIGKTMDDDW